MYVDLQQFAAVLLPLFSTLMEIPQGNTLENSGKQNPKMGFKSPPRAEEKNPACNSFGDFLIDSRPKNHEYDPPTSTQPIIHPSNCLECRSNPERESRLGKRADQRSVERIRPLLWRHTSLF